MKSFLTFLTEAEERQTLVFFPGSFKPPTKFHWEAIKQYAKIADEVQVIISKPSKKSARLTKNGQEITQDVVEQIFNIYKDHDHLNNVKIIKAVTPSPLASCLGHIAYNVENADIILGVSDKEEDLNRYDGYKKQIDRIESNKPSVKFLDPKKYAIKAVKNADNKAGSASDVRNNIDDFDYLDKNFFPDNLPKDKKEEIFKLLNPVTEASKDPLASSRVGIEKIAKMNPTAAKRLFNEIRHNLIDGHGLDLSISPKSDGQAIRLAWNSEKVFIESSHSGLIDDPSKIGMESFKEVLEYYQEDKNKVKLISILKGREDIGIKVFGELLYNKEKYRDKDNSITFVGTTYDSSKLGSIASIVLFDVKIMTATEIKDCDKSFKKTVIDYLVKIVSDKNITFFDNETFNQDITIKLSDFSEDNQDNIINLDEINKDQVKALQDELNYILVKHCQEMKKPEIILSAKSVEGLVFKIGDKNYSIQNPEWITTKTNFYKYTDNFNDVLMQFIKDVTGFQQRKKVLSIFDEKIEDIKAKYEKLLPQFLKDFKRAYSEFELNKDKMPMFVYLNNKYFIDKVYGRFSQLTPDVESFRSMLSPIQKESQQFSEGGNMFKNDLKTSRINQENVEATLKDVYEKVLPLLKVKKEDTAVLGSTGKKKAGGSSGDIDLAIDMTHTKFNDPKDFIKFAEKVADELNVEAESMMGLNLCSYRWPIANVDGKQEGEYVQLDLMPTTDIELMKWGMYSPHEDEYEYKGTVRNEFLNAIASFVDMDIEETYTDPETGKEKPLIWTKYSYIPQSGLFRNKLSKKPISAKKLFNKTPKKINSTFITSDPKKIVSTILGPGVKPEDVLTADDVFKYFKRLPQYKNQEIKDLIIAKTLKGLHRKEVKYPNYFMNELSDKSLIESLGVSLEETFDISTLVINDELLERSKIIAYNNDQQLKNEDGKLLPYNPKRFPVKAVDVIFPVGRYLAEFYLDTTTKCWASNLKLNGMKIPLNEEHYKQFFNTDFYSRLKNAIKNAWPLTDKFYANLYNGMMHPKIIPNQNSAEANLIEVDKDEDHASNGRKYVSFSDLGVSSKDTEMYCWPPEGKEFAWSSWKHWSTQKPFCKLIFKYNGTRYAVSIPLYNENFDNRGFRAYDIDWEPPLAWLSMQEVELIPKLSVFRKFIKHCQQRIKKFIEIDSEEIYKKINRPDKIEVVEINRTKNVIKKVLGTAISPGKFDNYKWRN